MVRLSAVVMAHPKRTLMAKRLASRLVLSVVWDQHNSVWDTGRRALMAANPEATHHLVIQDDAVAPRGLVAECERLLAYVPGETPVSLYMGRYRHQPRLFSMEGLVDQARKQGASFAVFGGPWWGVGVIVPVSHVDAIVASGDRSKHPNYDIRIAQFYASRGIDCWYTLPSIVDHRAGASLVGRRGSRRHAMWRADGSLAALNWEGGIITPSDLNLTRRFPATP